MTNTSTVEMTGGGIGLPSGGVAELKGLVVQQGEDLDTKHMIANVKDEKANIKACWKFTITFKESSGKSGSPLAIFKS